MKTYARVEHGVVRELVETDQPIEDLFHPGLLWVDIQGMPGVCPSWTVTQEGFSPPEPEKVVAATPTVDIAELMRQLNELREHIQALIPGATIQHPGEV